MSRDRSKDRASRAGVAPRRAESGVHLAVEAVLAERLLIAALEAMPALAFALDQEHQIVAANQRAAARFGYDHADPILGHRLDRLIHDGEDPPGVIGAVEEALATERTVRRECRLSIGHAAGEPIDVEAVASPTEVAGTGFVVLALRDVSGERRRRMLERVFFHDMNNVAGVIHGAVTLLLDEATGPVAPQLRSMLVLQAGQLVDALRLQAKLMDTEAGELQALPARCSVSEILQRLRSIYGPQAAADERRLALGPACEAQVVTDAALLLRVLGNMVTNALEASPAQGVVTVSAVDVGEAVRFDVHNDGALPEAVRGQLFQRSFSTKGDGRGVGTYSMWLFGERYLGGALDFASDAERGTVFSIRIPKRWRPPDERGAR